MPECSCREYTSRRVAFLQQPDLCIVPTLLLCIDMYDVYQTILLQRLVRPLSSFSACCYSSNTFRQPRPPRPGRECENVKMDFCDFESDVLIFEFVLTFVVVIVKKSLDVSFMPTYISMGDGGYSAVV